MERNVFNGILVVAKDIENYHDLNCKNTIPIYIEGPKYYSLFEPLVSASKIDCGDYLISYNDWHGFKQAIHVKKDKFDLQMVRKQANHLAHIINSNTVFMNVIDDLPPTEFHYVTFSEWEEFKTKGQKWEDQQIVICQTRSTVYVSGPMPLWGVYCIHLVKIIEQCKHFFLIFPKYDQYTCLQKFMVFFGL